MEMPDSKNISGGNAHDKDSTQCVKVAVNIRPLITTELLVGCTDCITVTPGEPQVQIGSHIFTFDHVFGTPGSPSSAIFDECVAPLVDAIFHGYNATVLAYGQTGSGKTYTMGTNYSGSNTSGGIIPKVMDTIFEKVEKVGGCTEFLIRVSFIEIFKEEVFDLLDSNPVAFSRSEMNSSAKTCAISKIPIQIRETATGGITLAGVTEAEVRSKEEMASFLARGSQSRATGSTNMNSQSSRSHAIFTISMEQRRISSSGNSAPVSDDIGDDILLSKLHLVDLAGSERVKRTGADGLRLKEGIHINKGLLALGNVISALGDDRKRKEGGHVPYRDSKLTRLLQDSLGGNSKTVMIACVSPADTNAEETLNTLKYANRARNIQNKAIINRDPVAGEMQRMRSQIEQLQAELLYYRGEGAPFDELQILQNRITVLEISNVGLHKELQESQRTCNRLVQRAVDMQVEKDKLIMKIEMSRKGKCWNEIDNSGEIQGADLVKTYISKIQELEGELYRLRSMNNPNQNRLMDCFDLVDGLHSKDSLLPTSCDELDEAEKEHEHSSMQDKLDKELQELDKRLEQKEAEMKRFAKFDTALLQQHYEKKILELEQEKKTLQKEIEELRLNLSNISSSSDDNAQKLKEDYLQKLNFLEAQVSELRRKQDAQSQLLKQKQKSDEAAKRLQEEIQRIKAQKVQLQHKIKQESEQFRSWKASREKEVLQLRKEGRRNEYEMHKLLALNQRQKMVLQRKTEEASLATKRLKELLEARKASLNVWGRNGANIQALVQAVEHELEVMVRVHEVRLKYEKQMEERAAMANEIVRLKEESLQLKQNIGDCSETMSPGARNSRILALEHMLTTSSSTLVAMASQLSEAEERERVFSGKGRWNQLHSLAEAKNVLNYLFNLASSSRCQLRDKEIESGEKESLIRELKEKIVKLGSLVRQLETQIAETSHSEKLREFSNFRGLSERTSVVGIRGMNIEDSHPYDLRKNPQSSQVLCADLEDMDTSESDLSEQSDTEWEQSNSKLSRKPWIKKRASKQGFSKSITPSEGDTDAFQEVPSLPLDTKDTPTACCSCSKKSLCKTMRCECRHSGSLCMVSCGCVPFKCTNREVAVRKEEPVELPQEEVEDSVNDKDSMVGVTVVEEVDRELASHGAVLLQSAFSHRPTEAKEEDNCKRKPLSDIGNTLMSYDAPKQQHERKKWGKKKSIIQLVPAVAQPPQHEDVDSRVPDGAILPDNIPLKLPRSMMPVATSAKPLKEQNFASEDAVQVVITENSSSPREQ